MGVPDIESFVKPGEFLLTTAYALRDDPKRLPALVRTLDRLQLAALAVKPGRYLGTLPDEMLAVVVREAKSFFLRDHVVGRGPCGVGRTRPGALGTAHRVPDDPKPRHETPLFQTAGTQAD